jgi:hypothetical protein
MPSENLRRVFQEIVESLYEDFKLTEELGETENNLQGMEGELRQYAKKEV